MTQYYAVIDTNVLIAALLTHKEDSATVRVMNEVRKGRIIPLYHEAVKSVERYLNDARNFIRRKHPSFSMGKCMSLMI